MPCVQDAVDHLLGFLLATDLQHNLCSAKNKKISKRDKIKTNESFCLKNSLALALALEQSFVCRASELLQGNACRGAEKGSTF